MSWLEEQTEQLTYFKTLLEDMDGVIADSSKHASMGTEQYKLMVAERYHVAKLVELLKKRIGLYCEQCTQCEECETVHLVLG